jgi:hypothetical protein
VKRIVLLLLLAGCSHTHVDIGAASTQGGVSAHIEGGRALAVLVGLSILAAGVYEAERTSGFTDTRYVPELEPNRRVSEQDCTRPLDYSLGNIRCK